MENPNFTLFKEILSKETKPDVEEVRKLYLVWNFKEKEMPFLKTVEPLFCEYFERLLDKKLQENETLDLEKFYEENVLILLKKIFYWRWSYVHVLNEISKTCLKKVIGVLCVRDIKRLLEEHEKTQNSVLTICRLCHIQKKYDHLFTKFFRIQTSSKAFAGIIKEIFGGDIKSADCYVLIRSIIESIYRIVPFFNDQSLVITMDTFIRSRFRREREGMFMGIEFNDLLQIQKCYESFPSYFLNFYKRYLTRRLVTKSSSIEFEEKCLQKLDNHFGVGSTTSMNDMIKDMKNCVRFGDNFRSEVGSHTFKSSEKLDFSVTGALRIDKWNSLDFSSIHRNLILPEFLKERTDLFYDYYQKKGDFRERKVVWGNGEAVISVYGQVEPDEKEDEQKETKEEEVEGEKEDEQVEQVEIQLRCTTLQMLILNLFNENEELTIEEICMLVGIGTKEILQHILALGYSEDHNGVLDFVDDVDVIERFCNPINFDPSEIQTYKVKRNDDYVCYSAKCFVDCYDRLEFVKKLMEPIRPSEIGEEEKWQLDTCIVRTMKRRKKLSHHVLVLEVFKQIQKRWKPHPEHINKRICSLIEREYIERSKDDKKIYVYIP